MNRSIAPEFSKAQDIKLIFPKCVALTEHINLHWLDETQDDTVKLDICWDAGSKFQSKPLTASFTNALLLSGSKDMTAHDISDKLDYQGGYVSHDIDKDQASITLYGLNDKIGEIFEVFSQGFNHVNFPEQELEKLKEIRKNGFKVSMEKVNTLCRQEFNKHIFGENTKYGKVAELSDFDKVESNDIKGFYNKFYREHKPTLFLVGKVSPEFIEQLKTWAKNMGTTSPTYTKDDYKQTVGRITKSKEGAIQSAIRIGHLMIQKNHPDYYKFQILNTILGGYFGSRLMANIREDKGYTYGIGSGLSVLDDSAYFFVATEVAKEVVDNTITEIYNEIEKLKNEYIPTDELEKVKNYLLGEFLRQADGPIAMMENFKNIYFNNLSEDYYTDFIHAVNYVTAKQLKELANKYWIKENMLEVVAG